MRDKYMQVGNVSDVLLKFHFINNQYNKKN